MAAMSFGSRILPVLLLCSAVAAFVPEACDAGSGTQALDWAAIRGVIVSQLEAFNRGDAVGAFSLAAPSVRKQYRSAREFMRRVRADYGPMYRPRSVTLLDHFVVSGQPVQPLRVVTKRNDVLIAYYVMQHQLDGSWKIAGCALHRGPRIRT